MKFVLDQSSLHRALGILGRSVASHPQLPVLGNIKLVATDEDLVLSATDLETGVEIKLAAEIEGEGETTVPAKVFSDYVSSLPVQKITGALEKNILALSCGSFSAEINCLGAEEFPVFPTVEGDPSISFAPDRFEAIVDRVAFAAAADDSRPVLAGVRVMSTKDGLVFTATDGYRLSQEVDHAVTDVEFSAVLPAKSLMEVKRIAATVADLDTINLFVSEDSRQLVFVIGGVVVSTRLIEGEFPNTKKIIPTDHATRALIDREEFTKAVRVVQVFARDSAGVVRLEFDPDGVITLSANTKQVGINTGTVDADIEGKENKVAFNVRYLQDLLGVLDADQIEFTMTEPLKPGVFRPVAESSADQEKDADTTEEKTDFFHLIMPVRVQE